MTNLKKTIKRELINRGYVVDNENLNKKKYQHIIEDNTKLIKKEYIVIYQDKEHIFNNLDQARKVINEKKLNRSIEIKYIYDDDYTYSEPALI